VSDFSTFLTALGTLGAAFIGMIYFFSRKFREKKQNEWREQLPSSKIIELGEWLLGFVSVLIILCAIVIAYFAGRAT
jgi:uncharacterized membrane protein YbhN (UPF0104 family)